jgi:hypothetical protein
MQSPSRAFSSACPSSRRTDIGLTMKTDSALAPMILAAFLMLGSGCGEPNAAPGEAPPQAGLPSGHPAIPKEVFGTGAGTVAGMVVETMDSGGYTYARLDTGVGEVWVAGPVTPLAVGERIALAGAAAMGSFTSASLGRTFDEIYFVGDFAADRPPENGTRGVARQVLSGAGYTYVEVFVSEAVSWIAGPEAEVQEGDTVIWQGGTEMGEFHSPTMNRSFDAILFVERIWVAH